MTFSSITVGGGVLGMDAGIVLDTITPAGFTIETFHPFIQGYPIIGGMTTGRIVGEDINGTTDIFLSSNSSATGEVGKIDDIGRNKTTGVSKV